VDKIWSSNNPLITQLVIMILSIFVMLVSVCILCLSGCPKRDYNSYNPCGVQYIAVTVYG
ncbi:MAG: hypothetical protein Solumvirus4_31, partial [Solumvirus sp.]